MSAKQCNWGVFNLQSAFDSTVGKGREPFLECSHGHPAFELMLPSLRHLPHGPDTNPWCGKAPPLWQAEFGRVACLAQSHTVVALSLSGEHSAELSAPIDTVPQYSLPQLAERLVWSPWTHSPPP